MLIFGSMFFCCCKNEPDIKARFNTLQNRNYSEFNDCSILYRKGAYIIGYKNQEYIIQTYLITNKIWSIKIRNGRVIQKYELEYNVIKSIIKSFNKLNVASLFIDKNKNVLFLFYSGKCAYYFLKLNKENSLKDLKKEYFIHYENNWYLNKECAE